MPPRTRAPSTESNLIVLGQALREDVQSARIKIHKARAELETLQAEFGRIKSERDRWREEAETPRNRSITVPSDLSMGSPEDYRAMVEQLVDCLAELQRKDVALQKSADAL